MQERRKQNKQVTIEKIEKELSDFATKEELCEAVRERNRKIDKIHEVIDFDGGLVYKCDLDKLIKDNNKAHEEIIKKLNEIYPRVKDEMEVAKAYEIIGNQWNMKSKSAGFWIKVVIGLSIFATLFVYVVDYLIKYFKLLK
jgi:hypothetical protein